jgi:hypothetical protein
MFIPGCTAYGSSTKGTKATKITKNLKWFGFVSFVVFAAFVRAVGSCAQLCNTHVSFDPPPCDELTTSDPLRSATRVSPPGAIVTLSP